MSAAAATASRKLAELVALFWLQRTSNSSDGRCFNKGASLRNRDLWVVISTMFADIFSEIVFDIAATTRIGVINPESSCLVNVQFY